jgi:phosphoacetylglucosamine mutase
LLDLVRRSKYSREITFDGANGVGVQAMERLLAALTDKTLLGVEFFSTTDKVLNKDCGSDFVKTEQRCPVGMSPPLGRKCVSFDGDADRVIYYYVGDDGFRLLDGDKIAALVAGFLAEAFKAAEVEAKLGVVQTAYANGSSTAYLEKVRPSHTPEIMDYLRKDEIISNQLWIYLVANGFHPL